MMLDVRQLVKDAFYLVLAQYFRDGLVLLGPCDAAVILPFPAFHLLIVELDGVDAHVLLRNGNFLFVYKIKNVPVDVRHLQAVDVAPFVVLHEVAEISPVGLYGGWAVAFLFPVPAVPDSLLVACIPFWVWDALHKPCCNQCKHGENNGRKNPTA